MKHRTRTSADVRRIIAGLKERGLVSLVEDICRGYNVTLEAVVLGRRSRQVVHARDACIHRILARARFSTVEVGEMLGMDASSVWTANERYKLRDNGRALT